MNNYKFRRQHPIGEFIADFYCHPLRLVIEIDGSVHQSDEAKNYDAIRDEDMVRLGIKVLRFSNHSVFNEPQKVVEQIRKFIADMSR